jgi:hypothetical protein
MTATITLGTPVKYHGSIKAEHWATWIVTAIADDGRYTVTDRDYPQSVLKQVRRTSITPTGDPALPMCACGHPVPWTLRGEDDVCAVCGWQCHNHTLEGNAR